MSPIQAFPTIKKDVPWYAVSIRKMKKEAKFGDTAVPMLKTKNRDAEMMLGHRRPYIVLMGPHKHGDRPIQIIYIALLKLMIEPDVLKVLATSGTAARIVVDEMGERKPHRERMAVMACLRRLEKRSYCAALTSTYVVLVVG
jgi:hypothetical protein